MEARKKQSNISKCLKNVTINPEFRNEGEVKTLPDEEKLREFVASRLNPKELLNIVLKN